VQGLKRTRAVFSNTVLPKKKREREKEIRSCTVLVIGAVACCTSLNQHSFWWPSGRGCLQQWEHSGCDAWIFVAAQYFALQPTKFYLSSGKPNKNIIIIIAIITITVQFYVFLTVHHSIHFSKYQLNSQFLYSSTICTLLNMFRAARCSSSGGPIVSPQPLVSSPWKSVNDHILIKWGLLYY